jgi:hypothetical protein
MPAGASLSACRGTNRTSWFSRWAPVKVMTEVMTFEEAQVPEKE